MSTRIHLCFHSYPLNDAAETVNEVGTRKLHRTIDGKDELACGAVALEAALSAVSTYGGAKAGYRTMLDALIPASDVLSIPMLCGSGNGRSRIYQTYAGTGWTCIICFGGDDSSRPRHLAIWYHVAAMTIEEKCKPSITSTNDASATRQNFQN
ncbi:hypothetical protein MLD38_012458 [Melastoma candidum]|uniref:Uncharacterized protein n=1 Tax=Melastoma candidum TaxID=119954 RepID=A0ACB9REU2_9MYRT|nr:hypothetical protein MLD38_012458 [Melastoma candidum]